MKNPFAFIRNAISPAPEQPADGKVNKVSPPAPIAIVAPAPVDPPTTPPALNVERIEATVQPILQGPVFTREQLRAQQEAQLEAMRAESREIGRIADEKWRQQVAADEAKYREAQKPRPVQKPKNAQERFSLPIYGYSDFGDSWPSPAMVKDLYESQPGPIVDITLAADASIAPICDRFEMLGLELGKCDITAPRALFRQIKAQNFQAAEEGRVSDIKELPDEDALLMQIHHRRAILRQGQIIASQAAEPIILDFAKHIQSAALKMATALADLEESAALKYELPYAPSPVLKKWAAVGLGFLECVKMHYVPTSRTDPRHFLSPFVASAKLATPA